MVDVAEVVLGQPHRAPVVGPHEQRATRRIDLDHRSARAVADAEAVVVAPADEAIARRPLATRGDESRRPEQARVVQSASRAIWLRVATS